MRSIDDRLEITSPGGVISEVTIERMKECRNFRIAIDNLECLCYHCYQFNTSNR
ncbi:hypothetical protein [Frisingicoccus sp.]|uniref:hypothetical protein n=1 Tax=Frisingicoccus sp. TaxID=1918627 RepID=UPI003AB18396